jgi:ParB-like chromosome segregation protein Spo0J
MNALQSGAEFPPITIEKKTFRLVDGRHRYEAFKRSGKHQIEVVEKRYLSEKELFAAAVILNIGHGAQFDSVSLERSIQRLTAFGYSQEHISKIVRVPPAFMTDIFRGYVKAEKGQPIATKGISNGYRAGKEEKAISHVKNVRQKHLQALRESSQKRKAIFYASHVLEIS